MGVGGVVLWVAQGLHCWLNWFCIAGCIIGVIPRQGCYQVAVGVQSGLHWGCIAFGVALGAKSILLFAVSVGVINSFRWVLLSTAPQFQVLCGRETTVWDTGSNFKPLARSKLEFDPWKVRRRIEFFPWLLSRVKLR